MRTFLTLAVAALVAIQGGNVLADHHGDHPHPEVGYFDAEHCTICRVMGEQPSLLPSMKWETHKIDNGMVMVSTMPEAKVSEYRECCAKMEAVAEKVMTGQVKDAVMCGFCQDFGKMMAAGAKIQKVKTQTGGIMIVTAGSAEAVKLIHQVADKSTEEMEKMLAAHSHDAHESHDAHDAHSHSADSHGEAH